MSTCRDSRKYLADLMEQRLSAHDRKKLEEHCAHCASCYKEYRELTRLCELLSADTVVLPDDAFFDHVRRQVRERELPQRGRIIRKIAQVLVPAALAVVIILLVSKPEQTVEISVPTAVLLEDRDVAQLSLNGVVTEQLLNELLTVEENLQPDLDEMLNELTEQEESQFVDELVALYGNGM